MVPSRQIERFCASSFFNPSYLLHILQIFISSYPPTHSSTMSFYLFPSFELLSPLASYKLTHGRLYSYFQHARITKVFLVSSLLPHYPHPSATSTHPYEFYPS